MAGQRYNVRWPQIHSPYIFRFLRWDGSRWGGIKKEKWGGNIYTLRFIRLVCNRRLLAQGNQCPRAVSHPRGCSQGDIGRKRRRMSACKQGGGVEDRRGGGGGGLGREEERKQLILEMGPRLMENLAHAR